METMDGAERERFLATLRADDSFRAEVRREILVQDVLNLPGTVATLVDSVAQQRSDFTALAQSMATFMEQTISGLRNGFAVTEQRFTEIRAGQSAFGDDLGHLRRDLGQLRGDVSQLRTDMELGFTAIDARFDQVGAEIRGMKADIVDMKADIVDVKADIVELKRSLHPPDADQE